MIKIISIIKIKLFLKFWDKYIYYYFIIYFCVFFRKIKSLEKFKFLYYIYNLQYINILL